MPRCSPPGCAECVAPGPLWCPWSAPGCLRCLRPSGGVVSRSQRPQFSSCCCRWRVRRACGGAGKGGPPCPLLWGCGCLVVPWHASCWGCVCGQDLAGCVSGRAGPSQRCGAWPAEGLLLFCPACRARLRSSRGPGGGTRFFQGGDGSMACVERQRRPPCWALAASAQDCPVACPLPRTHPRPQALGGLWDALSRGSVRGTNGWGRCALGEKAFSSDPRGCLGVPEPPAAAPPLRVVATDAG